MRDTIHFDCLTCSRRRWLLAIGTLVIGALIAGCIAGFRTSTPTLSGARIAKPSAGPAAPGAALSGEVAFARSGGGALAPGLRTRPGKRAMKRMLKVSQCMRRHGISWFPSPTTSVPSSMAGIGMVSDVDGAILVIPSALVIRSGPAYGQAGAVCGHGALGQPGKR